MHLPFWWTHVEVYYGFLNVPPAVVTLGGSYFGTYSSYDTVFRPEWACCVDRHFIYEACAGRLWSIPPAVRKDIRDLHLTDPQPELDHDMRRNADAVFQDYP